MKRSSFHFPELLNITPFIISIFLLTLLLNLRRRKIKNVRVQFIIALVLIGFVFTNETPSQNRVPKTSYSPPGFVFELTGSYDVPVGDARGELRDFFTFKNYGLVYGIGFQLDIKYAAGKKGNLYPYFSAGFCQLQNDDFEHSYIDSNIISYGYPLPGNLTYNNTNGLSILGIRIIDLSLGLQYYFTSKHSLLPFAGFEVNYNYIWGFYEQTPITVPGNAGSHATMFEINPASRVGIGIGTGMNYRISNHLGFVFGMKYKIANLFGKKSDKTQSSSINPADKNKMNLMDKSAPELNSNINTSRNISYLQFYIGFTVFAGSLP